MDNRIRKRVTGMGSIIDANHHPASRSWIDKTWFSRCQDETTQSQIAWQSVEMTFIPEESALVPNAIRTR